METRFEKVQAVKFVESQFAKEGEKSLHLKQAVETVYPSKQNKSAGLFSDEEMGIGDGAKFENTRNCIISVPQNATLEIVQKKLDSLPNARIKRVLSLNPILSEGQKIMIAKGSLSLETVKSNQTVVTSEGEVVLYEGHPMYRILVFSPTGEPDIDTREEDLKQMATIVAKEEVKTAAPKEIKLQE